MIFSMKPMTWSPLWCHSCATDNSEPLAAVSTLSLAPSGLEDFKLPFPGGFASWFCFGTANGKARTFYKIEGRTRFLFGEDQ